MTVIAAMMIAVTSAAPAIDKPALYFVAPAEVSGRVDGDCVFAQGGLSNLPLRLTHRHAAAALGTQSAWLERFVGHTYSNEYFAAHADEWEGLIKSNDLTRIAGGDRLARDAAETVSVLAGEGARTNFSARLLGAGLAAVSRDVMAVATNAHWNADNSGLAHEYGGVVAWANSGWMNDSYYEWRDDPLTIGYLEECWPCFANAQPDAVWRTSGEPRNAMLEAAWRMHEQFGYSIDRERLERLVTTPGPHSCLELLTNRMDAAGTALTNRTARLSAAHLGSVQAAVAAIDRCYACGGLESRYAVTNRTSFWDVGATCVTNVGVAFRADGTMALMAGELRWENAETSRVHGVGQELPAAFFAATGASGTWESRGAVEGAVTVPADRLVNLFTAIGGPVLLTLRTSAASPGTLTVTAENGRSVSVEAPTNAVLEAFVGASGSALTTFSAPSTGSVRHYIPDAEDYRRGIVRSVLLAGVETMAIAPGHAPSEAGDYPYFAYDAWPSNTISFRQTRNWVASPTAATVEREWLEEMAALADEAEAKFEAIHGASARIEPPGAADVLRAKRESLKRSFGGGEKRYELRPRSEYARAWMYGDYFELQFDDMVVRRYQTGDVVPLGVIGGQFGEMGAVNFGDVGRADAVEAAIRPAADVIWQFKNLYDQEQQ